MHCQGICVCFRCESIGTTDARLLIEGLQGNKSLTELDLSNNSLSDPLTICKGFADYLSIVCIQYMSVFLINVLKIITKYNQINFVLFNLKKKMYIQSQTSSIQ